MFTRRTLLASAAGSMLLPALARAAEPIKIGVIIPLSGGSGRQGQDVANAVQAMAALINADGGVLGREEDPDAIPVEGLVEAAGELLVRVAVADEGRAHHLEDVGAERHGGVNHVLGREFGHAAADEEVLQAGAAE